MSEMSVRMASHAAKNALEGAQGTNFDKVVAAMRGAIGDSFVFNDKEKLMGVMCALLDYFGEGSREYDLILKEIKVLNVLNAMARGVPVDFNKMPQPEDGEKSLGIGVLWDALIKGEDIEDLRAKIEGAPPKKGAPGWFRNDIDGAWLNFVQADEECSRLGRVLSNVEFQRDWLQKAIAKLGISLVVPHPEHPDDVEHKNRCLDQLARELGDLAAGSQGLKDVLENASRRAPGDMST